MKRKLLWLMMSAMALVPLAWANAESTVSGDVNGDGKVDIADVTTIIDHIHNKIAIPIAYQANADTNGDNQITIADATMVIDIIHGKITQQEPELTESEERAILVELYNATNGDNWHNNTNWCSNEPLTKWRGVSVANGHVVGLDLSGNTLVGHIPSTLGNLRTLKYLYLSSNQLTEEIPSTLGNLNNLEYLLLGSNQLTGDIPSTLGNLTNLKELQLYFNQLTGEIPSTLGNLTNLRVLFLHNNQLTKIPSTLGNLTNLTSMSLSFNQLTEIPSTLGNLTNLEYLSLSSNQLTGEIPSTLGNLTNLKELVLSSNKLTGEIPSTLGNLTNLKKLYLSDNQLTKMPSTLGNLINLKELGLSSNLLTGEIPSTLGNLANIEYLNLYSNLLTGEIPQSFNNLIGLIKSKEENGIVSYSIELYAANNNLTGNIPTLFIDSPAWRNDWTRLLWRNSYNPKDIYVPAPSFHVTDIDGNILDSKNIYPQQKLTAILHWATWCGWSKALISDLLPLYEKYKDYGFEIVGLTFNEQEETIRKYILEKGITWHNFISTKDNMLDYRVYTGYPGLHYVLPNLTPEISIVDNNGRVVFTDCLNERSSLSSFLRSELGEGKPDIIYTSTDFSSDGKTATLQTAVSNKDIKVVIMGDGFSDRQIADGSYDATMQKAKEALFSTEPFRSYRDKFTVKSVTAVSENEFFSESTKTVFSGYFGEGTLIGGNNAKVFEYAKKAIAEDDIDNAIIIVVMNSMKWAGTCYMYQPEKQNSWGSGASIAYVPNFDGSSGIYDYVSFESLLAHEAIGHGFAKLGDEYVTYQKSIPIAELNSIKAEEQYGWMKNVDFTNDLQKVKWNKFIDDIRYANELIGVYEGGLTYRGGVYRPSQVSIMSSDATYFNAPCRQAIWYRINKLTQDDAWKGTYEDFVEFDQTTNTPKAADFKSNARARATSSREQKIPMLIPPVIKTITWRLEK